MRITLILLALFLSGCETVDSLVKPQSEDEQFSERVDRWADSKIQEILVSFDGGLPLSSGHKVKIIPTREISALYAKMESEERKLQSNFLTNQENMAELKRIYDISLETSKDFAQTQSLLEKTIADNAVDFDEVVVRHNIVGLLSYCKSYDIEQSACKSGPYGPSSLAGNTILMRRLVDTQPQYRKHLDWLKREIEYLGSIADKVANYGVVFESNIYLRRAALSGCRNMSSFNFTDNVALAAQISYANFRPDKSAVFDLGHFKVLQSQSDGVLLSTTYSDSYNAPLVFAVTGNKYTDGYTFQPVEQFVCVAGAKEYISVLGAKKRVISFRAIQDNHKYYFFMK